MGTYEMILSILTLVLGSGGGVWIVRHAREHERVDFRLGTLEKEEDTLAEMNTKDHDEIKRVLYLLRDSLRDLYLELGKRSARPPNGYAHDPPED